MIIIIINILFLKSLFLFSFEKRTKTRQNLLKIKSTELSCINNEMPIVEVIFLVEFLVMNL